MKTIIIGLGNPGKEFENTPHNVGFLVVDEYSKKNNFSGFQENKKSNSLISEKEDVLLVKPQTYMNESGKAVKELIKNKEVKNIIVIHDDIDLPIGKIKIVQERGSAGHKGVESIIQNIGNNGLIRIRIGIEKEKDVSAKKMVLKNFSQDEQNIINDSVKKASEAIDCLISEGLDKAMNEYNK